MFLYKPEALKLLKWFLTELHTQYVVYHEVFHQIKDRKIYFDFVSEILRDFYEDLFIAS